MSCLCRLTNNISSNGFAPFLYRHNKPCPPKSLNCFCRGIALLCPAFPAQPNPSFRRYTMPRHYTHQDRQFALECLETNHGDISRTAKELGIGITTLYRWRELGKSG